MDSRGEFTTDHLSLAEFHAWHKNRPFQVGSQRPKPISEHWMEWSERREFEGIVFAPRRDPGPRWFNLWRGFRVEPAASSSHPSVDAFLEHARVNVCGNDSALFRWLMGYFAHMIQFPDIKPLVALVFKGSKGVGKNALVERVGWLLGVHFLVADDERYLSSNFNSHLENCLCMVLDEAVWAGSKTTEGRLKGLITGSQHNIERKGREPYRVDNLTRVIVLGNEAWLVPATTDERRFAVFNVGDGRRQDRAFFQGMREGMEAGGYAHLLRYLLDFDLAGIDVNAAPATQGLADQKFASLAGPGRWLADILAAGEIRSRNGFEFQWDEDGLVVPKIAAHEHYKERSRRDYGEFKPVGFDQFFKDVYKLLPGSGSAKPRTKLGSKSTQVPSLRLPALDKARKAFEATMGGRFDWGDLPAGSEDIFS